MGPEHNETFQTQFSPERVRAAGWIAGANWVEWRDCYEFNEHDVDQHPVLVNIQRYSQFLRQYAVLRGVSGEMREDVRQALVGSGRISWMVETDYGNRCEDLADKLARLFPGLGMQRSFLSKLGAFAHPSRFVAWDQYALRGAALAFNGPDGGGYETYPAYLNAIDENWPRCEERISGEIVTSPVTGGQLNKAYKRRVLDVTLMIIGGRWPFLRA